MTYVSGVEIGKTVRAQIKKAIKDGEIILPAGVKVSVRSDYNSVDVRIKGMTPDDLWRWGKNTYGYEEWIWTDEARALRDALEAIRGAGSQCTTAEDVGADYFTWNYYGGTQFDFVPVPKKES